MELFSQKFFSIYFIALIATSVLWMVTKILKNLLIDRTIKALIQLPDDRKERIIRLYCRIISIHRIGLWITPFGFFLLLVALILLFVFPELTSAFPDIDIRQFVMMGGILMVVGYIHFVEDSFYKKKILKAIDKS